MQVGRGLRLIAPLSTRLEPRDQPARDDTSAKARDDKSTGLSFRPERSGGTWPGSPLVPGSKPQAWHGPSPQLGMTNRIRLGTTSVQACHSDRSGAEWRNLAPQPARARKQAQALTRSLGSARDDRDARDDKGARDDRGAYGTPAY